MISSFCKAYAALGDKIYRELALRTMDFLEEKMQGKGIFQFYHCYTGK